MIFFSWNYLYMEENNLHHNSIILEDNKLHTSVFNNEANKLNYNYVFAEKDKEFNLLNNGKFKIDIFLNDIEFKNNYTISSNNIFKLSHEEYKEFIEEYRQIYKLSFTVLSENNNIDSYLKVIINKNGDESEEESKEGRDGRSSNTALIAIISTLSVIINVAAAALIIIKLKKIQKWKMI